MVVNKPATNLEVPEYAVPPENRIEVNGYRKTMMSIPPSRMFTIKEALATYKKKAGQDADVYDASQGDGGASLPGVPEFILREAFELQLQHGTGYDKPFGTQQFREVSANQYWQLDSESGWGPENIIFTQGGRDGLIKAYNAMIALGHGNIGDLLVTSRVPWISYNWGPYSIGLNVLHAPGLPEDSWRYTPEGIRACVETAEADGRNIAGIIITSPDNPTGRTIPISEQIELAQTALSAGIAFVLFDWIYHYVTDGGHNDINEVLNAFSTEDRERLIFLDGLTKSLGASNIRSAQLVAGKAVCKYITGDASHAVIPTYYSQAVAIAAFQHGYEKAAQSIIKPTSQSRHVLRTALENEGIPHVIGDGYYAFIDVGDYVRAGNYESSEELGNYLAEEFGIAVVPGIYFSEAGSDWVRFSYALPPERTQAAVEQFFTGLHSL